MKLGCLLRLITLIIPHVGYIPRHTSETGEDDGLGACTSSRWSAAARPSPSRAGTHPLCFPRGPQENALEHRRLRSQNESLTEQVRALQLSLKEECERSAKLQATLDRQSPTKRAATPSWARDGLNGIELYYPQACRKDPGLATCILYLLEHMGLAFETKAPEELPPYAYPCFSPPMVRMPDGLVLAQTPAIMSTLGRALDLGGVSAHDESHCQMVMMNVQDIVGEWARLRENKGRMLKWFDVLEQELATANSGYLVGRRLTYADYFAYPALCPRFEELGEADRELFPKLGNFMEMMKDLLRVSKEKLVAKGYPVQ